MILMLLERLGTAAVTVKVFTLKLPVALVTVVESWNSHEKVVNELHWADWVAQFMLAFHCFNLIFMTSYKWKQKYVTIVSVYVKQYQVAV